MDRAFANSVKSLVFFISTQTVKSRVHFFPNGGSTGGHYPVACSLTVFGKGIETRSIRLDGGRLNQPDGIRLEDAFPALTTDSSGICGLEVHLSCPQGRVNLTSSRVVIEMVSPQFSLTYSAAPFVPDLEGDVDAASSLILKPHRPGVAVGIQDESCSTSLIVVNASSSILKPDFVGVAKGIESPLQLGTAAERSATEFPLDDALCGHAQRKECLWGDSKIEKLWSNTLRDMPMVESYLLYREPRSRRPISVCAI